MVRGNSIPHDKKSVKIAEKEREALQKFKDRIRDLLKDDADDFSLEKWLKARKYNVKEAEEMFRASMVYREKMGVGKILTDYEPPEVLQKYLPGGFCGVAKDGSPVRIELYGKLDMKGLMRSVKKSDLEKTKLQHCEWTIQEWERESIKRGYRVDGLTVLFDMEGVSTRMLWRPGIQMYLHMVQILEDNYPEMMRRLLVINAPRIFPLLYKLVRPLITDDMKSKIHVLSGNYKETLLKYINEDNLPTCYGGKMTDPDGNPKCVTKICQGGVVPKEYHIQTTDVLEHMITVTVPHGDKVLLDYQVEQPGSVLRWEFRTDGYDIGFGISFKTEDGTEPVIPVSRVNSHVVAEDGNCTCDKPGTYFLCFDNKFSWTRNKVVHFTAEVIPSVATQEKEIKREIGQLIEKES